MPSAIEISECFGRANWVQDTLNRMVDNGQVDDGLEANNVARIMKTNRASCVTLMAAGTDGIGAVSFWVTKKTVDRDFKTVSAMNDRKGL